MNLAQMLPHYCEDCGKLLVSPQAIYCQKCAKTGKRNPRWKDGRIGKQYYCKDCGIEIYFKTALYGGGFCHSCAVKGNKNPLYGKTPWNKDLIGVQESWNKGLHPEYMQGKNHPNYKGGTTPLYEAIRKLGEYKQWRSDIFQRDNWTCQTCGLCSGCGKAVRLEAHHKKDFAVILAEFLQVYDQFSPFEDRDTLTRLSFTWQPFWDVSNGVTLCYECHQLTKKRGER